MAASPAKLRIFFRGAFSGLLHRVARKPAVRPAGVQHQMSLVQHHLGLPTQSQVTTRLLHFKDSFANTVKQSLVLVGLVSPVRKVRKFPVRRLINGSSQRVFKKCLIKRLAVKRLIKELNLYNLEFKRSTKVTKDKALVYFHPYFTPSKVKLLQLLEETSEVRGKLRKESLKKWISAIVIICSLIEQSSKPESFAHHTHSVVFKKVEGWNAARDMGWDLLGLLERQDLEDNKESVEKLQKVAVKLQTHVGGLKTAAHEVVEAVTR